MLSMLPGLSMVATKVNTCLAPSPQKVVCSRSSTLLKLSSLDPQPLGYADLEQHLMKRLAAANTG